MHTWVYWCRLSVPRPLPIEVTFRNPSSGLLTRTPGVDFRTRVWQGSLIPQPEVTPEKGHCLFLSTFPMKYSLRFYVEGVGSSVHKYLLFSTPPVSRSLQKTKDYLLPKCSLFRLILLLLCSDTGLIVPKFYLLFKIPSQMSVTRVLFDRHIHSRMDIWYWGLEAEF